MVLIFYVRVFVGERLFLFVVYSVRSAVEVVVWWFRNTLGIQSMFVRGVQRC